MSAKRMDEFDSRYEPLHQAVQYDNLDFLEGCLKDFEDEEDCSRAVNSKDDHGFTPLLKAIKYNSPSCLEKLLERGADPNLASDLYGADIREPMFNITPLHLAVTENMIDLVKCLLSCNVDLTLKDGKSMTAEDIARKMGFQDVNELFLEEITQRTEKLNSCKQRFINACVEGDIQTANELSGEVTDFDLFINEKIGGNATLLFSACEKNVFETVVFLIGKGADLSIAHSTTGQLPIHVACQHGTKLLSILLNKFPASVNYTDNLGCLPVHMAANTDNPKVLKYLLDYQLASYNRENWKNFFIDNQEYTFPFDVNAETRLGETPLQVACDKKQDQNVAVLLNFQVPVTATDCEVEHRVITIIEHSDHYPQSDDSKFKDNQTPDSSDVEKNKTPVSLNDIDDIELPELQVKTVHPVKLDSNGKNLLFSAVKHQSKAVAEVLLKFGADPNKSQADGSCQNKTPLMMATENCDLDMMDLLLSYRAQDIDNYLLSVAISRPHPNMVSMLLKYKTFKDEQYNINKEALRLALFEKRESSSDFSENVPSAQFKDEVYPRIPVAINWHNENLPVSKLRLEKGQTEKEEWMKEWLIDAAAHHNLRINKSPESTTALFSITRLYISNNRLHYLPDYIFSLASIQVLDVSGNEIEELSESLPGVAPPWLGELHLARNNLKTLPSWVFSKLSALTKLDVSSNHLLHMPAEMWSTLKLKELDLSDNELSDLPKKKICSIKGTLTNFNKKLPDIDLDSNSLLPEDIDDKVPDTRYKSDPSPSSRSLSKTVSIDSEDGGNIKRNREIQECRIFSPANVDECPDENIEQRSPLNELNLSYNKFSTIPNGLPCFASKLKVLDMSHNKLTKVGHPHCYPPNIEKLNLSHNAITEMVPCIGMFSNDLDCFDKQLKKRTKSRLSSKSRLSVESERLNRLNFKCVHQMQEQFNALHSLYLSNNRALSTLQLVIDPETPAAAEQLAVDESKEPLLLFPNLSTLDLSGNRMLSEIPKTIGNMKSLNQLLLQCTGITTLPTEIGELPNLWDINLEYCRNLTGHLKHLVEAKSEPSLIRGYLKSLHLQETEYNRLTLMVVGAQKVGKTVMLEQLRHYEGNPKIIQKSRSERLGFEKPRKMDRLGPYIPTDGVDINSFTMKHGKTVHIRGWDFGGQKNYFATHQYFLSPRALYLVVWNIEQNLEDGLKMVHQWLVNIQARAPNSPVIIVGTHKDLIPNNRIVDHLKSINEEIRKRFMDVSSPSSEGLPIVVNHIEISCKTSIFTGHKMIEQLSSVIQETLKEAKDGTGQPLVGQKIPKSYLDLEDIVEIVRKERSKKSLIPIVEESRYKAEIQDQMRIRKKKSFDRDELRQATMFLNSYGVLLHYEDPALSRWYFLDPQWLYDMLATIVSVSLGYSWKLHIDGLMADLANSKYNQKDIHKYICNLLSKFELALRYDENYYLIAPLLLTEMQLRERFSSNDPNAVSESSIPLKVMLDKIEAIDASKISSATSSPNSSQERKGKSKSKFYVRPSSKPENEQKPRSDTNVYIDAASHLLKKKCELDPATSMIRLYLMSCFPSEFWPRLITRIINYEPMVSDVSKLFLIPDNIKEILPSSTKAEWHCYQTGLELVLLGCPIVLVREITSKTGNILCDYKTGNIKLCVNSDDQLNMEDFSVLEILIPHYEIQFFYEDMNPIFIQQSHRYSTKVLANIVFCIDNLLEELYPNVYGRFRQITNGKQHMVYRIIPCMPCYMMNSQQKEKSEKFSVGVTSQFRNKDEEQLSNTADNENSKTESSNLHAFTVEYCIDHFQSCCSVICPTHGSLVDPSPIVTDFQRWHHIAPDLAFLDLPYKHLINNKNLIHEKDLSNGGFGVVRKAIWKKDDGESVEVAWKILELVRPCTAASDTARNEFEGKLDQVKKDPTRSSCESYLLARRECSVMTQLNHESIVTYLGLCIHPISLVLELAPYGELFSILKNFQRNGASLPVFAISQIIIKISSALEYLHSRSICHRDLKSSNVMVWSMPLPHQMFDPTMTVSVKLSDYGISQFFQTGGLKGYAGTPGYMAPEIIRHMGEECYSEKVDCFSFGMFIYELLMLKEPFENEEPKTAILNQAARPTLSHKWRNNPMYILDLMALCWSDDPEERPSACEIHQIAQNPQFCHVMSSAPLPTQGDVDAAVTVLNTVQDEDEFVSTCDLWLACFQNNCESLEVISYKNQQPQNIMTISNFDCRIHTMCQVNEYMWCASRRGTIIIYSVKDHKERYKFSLNADNNPTNHATHITFLPERQQVLLTMTDGQFVICNAFGSADGCTTFEDWLNEEPIIKRYPGLRKKIFSVAVFRNLDDNRLEIWCGQERGVIQVWDFDKMEKQFITLNHFMPVNELVKSYFIVSSPDDNKSLWTYTWPGNHVFRWDGSKRCKVALLDSSKCVPFENRDVIKKYINNGRLQAAYCQVTALNVLYNEVYIGTTWGCIIVADKTTLRLITTIRCHSNCENYIRSILAIPIIDMMPQPNDSQADVNYNAKEAILSVGCGFRSLMRFTKAYHREMQLPKYNSDSFVLTFFSENWRHY